nr:zinc finger, CCHC-type [Tanacetum cinerariifolium]
MSESLIRPIPVAPAGQHVAFEILEAHNAWIKGSKEIVGFMLMTMDPEIQRNLKPLHAHATLMEEGQSNSSYVLKMMGYIDNLERLGHPVKLGLGNHGNGKIKQAYAPKPKIPPPPKRKNPAKDSICYECGEVGHWKRNCPPYLAELMKKKKNAASGAGGLGLVGNSSRGLLACTWAMFNVKLLKQLALFIYVSLVD